MASTKNTNWNRFSIEVAAIVGGILLAFAIDAWWEERQERNEETEQLSRLRDEFITNIERVDQRAKNYSLTVQGSIDIFTLIDAAIGRGDITVEVPAEKLRYMLFAPTFEADTPVLDGLIRSGRLEIVEDRRILAALARWERLLRDYTLLAERVRRNIDAQLLPALYSRSDIGPILVREAQDFPTPDDTAAVQADFVTIRIDEELKGFAAGRFAQGRQSLGAFDRLQTAGESVIESIDATISK